MAEASNTLVRERFGLCCPRSRPLDPKLPNVGLFLAEKTAGVGCTLGWSWDLSRDS